MDGVVGGGFGAVAFGATAAEDAADEGEAKADGDTEADVGEAAD